MSSQARSSFALRTRRFELTECTERDLDFLASLLGSEDVMRFYPRAFVEAGPRSWLERVTNRYANDGMGTWVVRPRGSGERLALIGLLRQTIWNEEVDETSYLVARAHWGEGIATEVASACRDHSLFVRGEPAVYALIREDNVASRRVAERMGMRVVGEDMHAELPHLVHRVEAPAGICIRAATPADEPEQVRIFRSNVDPYFVAEELAGFLEYVRAPAGPYWVVEDAQGNLVACGGWSPARDDASRAQMVWGMVERTRHKTGLGGVLLRARMADAARHENIVTMGVNTSQHTSGFFARAGFRVTETRENAYAPGLHRVNMLWGADGVDTRG